MPRMACSMCQRALVRSGCTQYAHGPCPHTETLHRLGLPWRLPNGPVPAQHRDELHDGIAGEFAFSNAKLCYYDALTLVEGNDPTRAEEAAEGAITLYQNGPAMARSYGCEVLARAQLARAQLMNRKLEDAAESLRGVLALDPQMHIHGLAHQLETCRRLLVVTEYRSSGTVRQMDRQLAAFSRAGAAAQLLS